jgi:enamine deaminase RidA (YjgF/YER057c/UK114 family)
MRTWEIAISVLLLFLSAAQAKKKNPDDITQTLELPKDPPMVAVGETRRLMFHVSPLSAKGLLSQQTRDALKAILKANGSAQIIHIRAFVAGSGDVRRVPQIVSEILSDKKMPLPSVSVIQAGALPLENAQIVVEAVSAGKKESNPNGLMFVEGQPAAANESPASLVQKSVDQLTARIGNAPALRVSCFISALGGIAALAPIVSSRFPGAAIDIVQTQRAPLQPEAVCEAVARGGNVTADRLAFSGTQVAFGAEEKAALLAFQRLDRELEEAGAAPNSIVTTSIYPVSAPVAQLARRLRKSIGALTIIPFEGVASADAGFAIDAIAAVSK